MDRRSREASAACAASGSRTRTPTARQAWRRFLGRHPAIFDHEGTKLPPSPKYANMVCAGLRLNSPDSTLFAKPGCSPRMRTPVQCSQKQLISQLPCTGLPPTPHVPLLRHERARGEPPEHEAVLLRYAVDQRTPLRPMPLAMQRSPLLDRPRSPACDQPPRSKATSPLVASSPLVRTPSKFAPYTGDRYTLEGVLGKGAFGLVSLMREVRSGEVVAMKTIERAQLRRLAL